MKDHTRIVTFHADNKACLAEYIRPLLTEQEKKKKINDTVDVVGEENRKENKE